MINKQDFIIRVNRQTRRLVDRRYHEKARQTTVKSSGLAAREVAQNDQLAKIKLVPLKLHEHLFGDPTEAMRTQMIDNSDCIENQLELPQLRTGKGHLMEHFRQIANEQFDDYHKQLEKAMQIQTLPPMPQKWIVEPGWTAYDESGAKRVKFPDEKLLFFDIEVCVKDNRFPTMAVALSPTTWYSWCSERLADESVQLPEYMHLRHLIPLDDPQQEIHNNKRLIIGHNIAYDRQYVREQYLQYEPAMRFWCTMSMHIACSGMADHQRNLYEKSKLNGRDFVLARITEEGPDGIPKFTPKFQDLVERWKKRTCKNSLEAVHIKYCGDTSKMILEKQWQGFFVKKSIEEIREHSQQLFTYCAFDVHATFNVFQKLYPKFRERFPHPITSCGMMEMTNVYLPINANWRRFYDKCENIASTGKNKAAKKVIEVARELVEELDKDAGRDRDAGKDMKKYELDPWMWVSKWLRPNRHKEWPTWYLDIFQTKTDAKIDLDNLDAESVKLLSREIPRIFGLRYGPYPLMHLRKFGWGFLVPSSEYKEGNYPLFQDITLEDDRIVRMPVRKIYDMIEQNKIDINDVITRQTKPVTKIGPFDFYRLPHSSGQTLNVGTPFAKSNKLNFDNFELDVISPTRYPETLKHFLETRNITRFWGNYRDRYQEQLPIWLDDNAELGAIAPPVVPAGTVTRRAVHKLWLVSMNPKKEVIGSDLKSMIQCAEGWNFVGADVDSQEQWIAALFGDSIHETRRAGITEFSNMLLAGNKMDKTDLHSVVANQVGISRDNAKVLNYARLYGSGAKHAQEYLKLQGINEFVANKLTKKLFDTTKGTSSSFYELNERGKKYFKEFLRVKHLSLDQMMTINGRSFLPAERRFVFEFENWLLDTMGLDISSLISPGQIKLYRGGYESSTFNFLSLNSNELHPKTPVLNCQLSESIEPFPLIHNGPKEEHIFNQMYTRTIINWFVQSSAVDFLHMLLVCMRWLCTHYDIPIRFVISIHDEVRYLVPSEHRYRCALALTLSNMYVRAAFSEALGIPELPRSIAFFSQVDIDTVLRKEVNMECQTPDGKIVERGEALSIDEIVRQTGGSLRRKRR